MSLVKFSASLVVGMTIQTETVPSLPEEMDVMPLAWGPAFTDTYPLSLSRSLKQENES